jgi:cell division protein FtsB
MQISGNLQGIIRWAIIILMLLAFFWIQYLLWFDEYGFGYHLKQKKEMNAVLDLERSVKERYQRVRNEVDAWHDNPEMIEEEGRESLGMIAKDEELYVIQ